MSGVIDGAEIVAVGDAWAVVPKDRLSMSAVVGMSAALEEAMPGRRFVVFSEPVDLVQLTSLDAAWKAAEAALPEGWCDLMVYHYDREPGDHHTPGQYGAKTADPERNEPSGSPFEVYGYGPTPAAALLALAAALSDPAA